MYIHLSRFYISSRGCVLKNGLDVIFILARQKGPEPFKNWPRFWSRRELEALGC